MMNAVVKSKMMDKVMGLQDWICTMTDINGVEFFNITATGTRYNQDITVYGLDVEITKEVDGGYVLLINDLEDTLVDRIHPLAMVSLDRTTKINIADDSITVLMGAETYTITPVRG